MKSRRGFSLIEVVITVAIVALLATAGMPLLELTVKRGREADLRAGLREIRTALDAYKKAADEGRIEKEADASGYPPSLAVLVDGVEDVSSPEHRQIFFLRRLPRDPFFPDAAAAAADTWGLRAYDSAPQDPRAGDDVYDVYSLATGRALDGSAYRDW